MNPSPSPSDAAALAALRTELKALILAATEKDEPAGGLREDEPLFGPEARLDLDSMDALQLSMALQKAYGVRMPDSKETRRAFASVAHLSEHLMARGVGPRGAAGTSA